MKKEIMKRIFELKLPENDIEDIKHEEEDEYLDWLTFVFLKDIDSDFVSGEMFYLHPCIPVEDVYGPPEFWNETSWYYRIQERIHLRLLNAFRDWQKEFVEYSENIKKAKNIKIESQPKFL